MKQWDHMIVEQDIRVPPGEYPGLFSRTIVDALCAGAGRPK
jgi:hypothetical protein